MGQVGHKSSNFFLRPLLLLWHVIFFISLHALGVQESGLRLHTMSQFITVLGNHVSGRSWGQYC